MINTKVDIGFPSAPHIGLVGCGQWGNFILRDLLTLGCCCSVADISQVARDKASQAGAHLTVEQASELPNTIDGYIVATPATTHYQVIMGLLGRHRPIYVEKPLTNNPDSATELARIAADRLFVMEKWRYHPGINMMAQLFHSNTLGRLLTLRCRRVQWQQSQQDVNPVWTLLPHDLSIADHILGNLPTPMYAYTEEDTNGIPLSLSAYLESGDIKVFIEVSSLTPVKERKVALTFEGGTLMLEDPLADHLLFKARGSSEFEPCTRIPISTDMPLFSQLRSFVSYLAGGSPPLVDCAKGAQSVILIQQLITLAKSANQTITGN